MEGPPREYVADYPPDIGNRWAVDLGSLCEIDVEFAYNTIRYPEGTSDRNHQVRTADREFEILLAICVLL